MKININTEIVKFTADENGKTLDINMTPKQLLIAKACALLGIMMFVGFIVNLCRK